MKHKPNIDTSIEIAKRQLQEWKLDFAHEVLCDLEKCWIAQQQTIKELLEERNATKNL